LFNLFCSYFQQALNSIVSQCFYITFKSIFKCQNCSTLYRYFHDYIFVINVDESRRYRDQAIIQRKGCNLSLEECFECYTGEYSKICNKCGNNGHLQTSVVSTSKIVINLIYL
jgi:hypothetical protein